MKRFLVKVVDDPGDWPWPNVNAVVVDVQPEWLSVMRSVMGLFEIPAMRNALITEVRCGVVPTVVGWMTTTAVEQWIGEIAPDMLEVAYEDEEWCCVEGYPPSFAMAYLWVPAVIVSKDSGDLVVRDEQTGREFRVANFPREFVTAPLDEHRPWEE